jgi:hypothetical protein
LRRASWALALAAYVGWFGGLLRLLAEAVAQIVPEVAPTEGARTSLALWTVGSIVVGVVVIALLLRWPWYRGVLRQTQEDIAALHGHTVPQFGQTLRRVAGWSAIIVLPAAVLAILLPSPAAAAVAIVVGLVLRVIAVLAVASPVSAAH